MITTHTQPPGAQIIPIAPYIKGARSKQRTKEEIASEEKEELALQEGLALASPETLQRVRSALNELLRTLTRLNLNHKR